MGKIWLFIFGLIVLSFSVLAQQDKNQSSSGAIIVVGENASVADLNIAKNISDFLGKKGFNVSIVNDSNFTDDGFSTIISIGGSCVNRVSAILFDVDYPACGPSFSSQTNVGIGEFTFKTFALTNNRLVILIAGYNQADTMKAAQYFMSQNFMNMTSGTNIIQASNQTNF